MLGEIKTRTAGTPVIFYDNTTAGRELVGGSIKGLELPLDAMIWAEAANPLLTNSTLWERFSRASRELGEAITDLQAGQGVVEAVRSAVN